MELYFFSGFSLKCCAKFKTSKEVKKKFKKQPQQICDLIRNEEKNRKLFFLPFCSFGILYILNNVQQQAHSNCDRQFQHDHISRSGFIIDTSMALHETNTLHSNAQQPINLCSSMANEIFHRYNIKAKTIKRDKKKRRFQRVCARDFLCVVFIFHGARFFRLL